MRADRNSRLRNEAAQPPAGACVFGLNRNGHGRGDRPAAAHAHRTLRHRGEAGMVAQTMIASGFMTGQTVQINGGLYMT